MGAPAMKKISLLAFILAAFVWLTFNQAKAQTSRVYWYTFDMGFAVSSAGNSTATSAVGQTFVGSSRQMNTLVESGFLADTLLRGPLVGVEAAEQLPTVYALLQNYPNPFNPTTTIRYELPRRSKVELHIYNILGQHVATLAREEQDAGRYLIQWNGRNDAGLQVSSGVYFYRIHATDAVSSSGQIFVNTKKLMLLR